MHLTRILLLISSSISLAAHGQDYDAAVYVDLNINAESCSDYDPATRRCGNGTYTAFATIVAAAATLRAGLTILIQPGEYAGGIVVRSGGAEQAPVVFQAVAPGVVIEGSGGVRDAFFINEADHVHITGITIQNANRAGLRISQSDHVQVRESIFRNNGTWGVFTDFSDYTLIEDCETSGSGTQHGIYVSNSSDSVTLRGNLVHDNAGSGIQINADASMGGDGISSDAVIENNVIYENGRRGGAGINLDGVTGALIRNNLLYENHASGIALFRIDGAIESHSNQILNNTIINARFGRWALNLQSTAHNRVYNNIILNDNRFRGSILVRAPIGDGFASDFNIVMDSLSTDGEGDRRITLSEWQQLGFDLNSTVGDRGDLFTNASGDDYSLAADSLAMDRGTAIDQVETDISGMARPAGDGFDIGAYEFPH